MNLKSNKEVIEILKKSKKLFNIQNNGVIELHLGISSLSANYTIKKEIKKKQIINSINDKLWKLLATYQKIIYLTFLWEKNKNLKVDLWRQYVALDIDNFFTLFRSLFDLIIELSLFYSIYFDKIPKKRRGSFNTLCEWLTVKNEKDKQLKEKKRKENVEIMGDELSKLILDIKSIFYDIKIIRDKMVHQKGQNLVFGNPSKIVLCDFYDEYFSKIIFSKYNFYLVGKTELINFNLFGVFYIACLFDFLEKLIKLIHKKENFKEIEGFLTSMGLEYVKKYIDELLSVLNN